jgi:hypothetical protein
LGIPLIAAIAAIGAVQLATVAAKPIPEYEKGTDYHPGGPALVGEKRRELVILPTGNSFITPGRPTIFDLPKGAEVLPDLTSLYAKDAAKIPKAKDRPVWVQLDMSSVIRSQNETKDAVYRLECKVNEHLGKIRRNGNHRAKIDNAFNELRRRRS